MRFGCPDGSSIISHSREYHSCTRLFPSKTTSKSHSPATKVRVNHRPHISELETVALIASVRTAQESSTLYKGGQLWEFQVNRITYELSFMSYNDNHCVSTSAENSYLYISLFPHADSLPTKHSVSPFN